MPGNDEKTKRKIGLALGSGSARGWAHVGVIQELSALSIEPDIICGTSIGALVGAAYVKGRLDSLESWLMEMNARNVVKYFDLRLLVGGGFVEGKRLMDFLRNRFGEILIQDLPKQFAAVATDLKTGKEVWLKDGSLWDAVRASIALPGFITPVHTGEQWLVDGGLVNPVPVSLCRAMGADVIVAVNLNGDIVGRHFSDEKKEVLPAEEEVEEDSLFDRLTLEWKKHVHLGTPGLFDVLAGSINIMQDRITGGRLANYPPDVMITPKLGHVGLLEFDRSAEAISEGRAAVQRVREELKRL